MSILGGVYGRAAAWRRAWYDRHPDRRRQLGVPVISVGNLVVGGSGKTPTVAALARLLQSRGERPAILSRGYGRRASADGVVVVSDGTRVLAGVAQSGDEPQMLARALPGVPVLVAAERFLAGRLAERQFGVTVHLLDDGFQHLPLARDVDLLIAGKHDLDERVLPAGRLREPLTAARHADALLVPGTADEAREVAQRLGVSECFRLAVRYEPLGSEVTRVMAVAAIARPERFFDALRAQGYDVVRTVAFRDHHWFSDRDVQGAERAAREAGAEAIVTTEKDAVRLGLDGGGRPAWLVLRMHAGLEPTDRVVEWLTSRLDAARARRGNAA